MVDGSGSCVTGYARMGHDTINLVLTGMMSMMMIVILVLLVDTAIAPIPNLEFSLLNCLLLGMLIVRMQLAHELEKEEIGHL